MSLVTATISGLLARPDLGRGAMTVVLEAATDGSRVTWSGGELAGPIPVRIASDGTASVSIPTTDQAGISPTGFQWKITQKISGQDPYVGYFSLTGNTTWDTVFATATGSITPSILTETLQARDQAQASATAAAGSAAAASAIADPNGGYAHQIGNSNGTNDTSALNGLLTTPGFYRGTPGQNYLINAPLVIKSGTTLDMTGCTVTLLSGSDCNMLRNEHYASGARDTEITIRGGTWARGSNAGSGTNDGHSLFLRRIDGLTVEKIHYTSSLGKYGIGVGDVTAYKIRDITAACASDTIHITGPATDGLVENVESTGGDDIVGITTTDYTVYDDVHGDINQLTVRNIAGNTPTRVVLVSGSANNVADGFQCKNITVEKIRQTNASGSAVYVASQVAGTAMTHDALTIKNVRGGSVLLIAPHIGLVTVEDAQAEAGYPAVTVGMEASPQTANVIDRLVMRNCRGVGTGSDLLSANNNATVLGQVDLYECSTSTSGATLAYLNNASTEELRLHGCVSSSGQHAILVDNAANTIRDIVLNGHRATNPVNGYCVVRLSNGAVTSITYNDPDVTAVNNNTGSLASVSSTATLGTLHVHGGYINGTAALLDISGSSSAVTTAIRMCGTRMVACNRIVQAGSITLDFAYSNITVESGVNEPIRIYSSGVANIRGSGWFGNWSATSSAVVRGASEVIHVGARDFPADVSILTGAAGDRCSNTNGGVAPYATGPVIRDNANANWIPELGYSLASTATLAAGTVTVSNTHITASSVILLGVYTPGGTQGAVYVSAKSPGTSFTIKSTSASDTSTVYYRIVNY